MKKLFILILFILFPLISYGQNKNLHILCNDSSLLKIEIKNLKYSNTNLEMKN